MDTELRDELDRCFGHGPAVAPHEDPLVAGRRALRRRRRMVGAAAAAVVVVAGASYAVASSGTDQQTRGETAVQPTPSASAAPRDPEPRDPQDAEPDWEANDPVRYVDGQLEVRPGATVHVHLVNPYGYQAPDTSDGLDITYQGQRTWVLAEYTREGLSYLQSEPSNGWAGFRAWVHDQVGGSGDGWPATVVLTEDFQVVAAPGAEIVQRTDDPRLGPSFAPVGAQTGAAMVELGGEPPSYFVVWRVIDGELDVITTPPRDVVGATFDELLSYARGQYSNGEGLR